MDFCKQFLNFIAELPVLGVWLKQRRNYLCLESIQVATRYFRTFSFMCKKIKRLTGRKFF